MPRLYLPDRMLASLAEILGALLRAPDGIGLFATEVGNTGFIITDGVPLVDAGMLKNRKRLADG